jgi:tol-pal system protein YbgF
MPISLSSLRRLMLAAVALAGFAAPAVAQDGAELFVRIQRLEAQMRAMSGQIEELQHENRRLQDQLKRFQQDVDFRLQDGAGGAGAGGAGAGGAGGGAPARPQRRGDVFEPSANPQAAGAPRPLGATTPSAPLATGPAATGGVAIIEETAPGAGPLDLSSVGRAPPARPSVAATGSVSPREDFDAAYTFVLQRDYESAEMGFRRFLQSHPRDRLAADATFWLGETYLQRQRYREAAEQFLKVTTDHARSAKAPESMVRLAASLTALGAREQACATLSEVPRKYPQAAPGLSRDLQREQRRARCV